MWWVLAKESISTYINVIGYYDGAIILVRTIKGDIEPSSITTGLHQRSTLGFLFLYIGDG